MSYSSQHEQHAKNLVSGILTSDSLGDIWAKHHKSKADSNPAINIAQEVQNITKNIENHPEMLLFMRSLIEIELIAAGKPKNNDPNDIKDLKKYLNKLYSYTNSLIIDNDISLKNTELPKEYQSILNMLEYQTGKAPLRPIKSLWNITKSSAAHIKEDAKEHPILFGSLVSVAVGMVYVSTINVNKFATIYTEENLRHIADTDADLWDDENIGDFTTDDFSFDPSLAESINLDPSCHETTVEMGRLIAGDYGAGAIKHIPSWITDIFPEHCTKIKTLASDAIGGLQGGFGWVHQRLDVVIRDPANNIGDALLQNSVFQTAFIDAANIAADFWYRFNDIENIAVHTLLTGVTAATVVKYDSLSTDESQKWKREISNFFHRTTQNLPLSYTLACGGSVYAYMANEGVSPDMLWMGVGGAIAGNTLHKISRSTKSNELVEKTTISIKKSIAEISDSLRILTDEITDNNHPYEYKGWKDYARKPAIIAGAAAALTSIDMAVTNGQLSGALAGTATVSSQYFMYNVVEDTALHGIFITLGIAIGKTISYSSKAGQYLKDKLIP